MVRRSLLLLAAVAALALVPAAVADGGGPSPGTLQGWDGVENAGGTFRYVAVPDGTNTVVERIRTADGRVYAWNTIAGGFGTPLVAQDGTAGGLSTDGRTLVLAQPGGGPVLRTTSRLAVFDTRSLKQRLDLELRGDFAFDALSPDGRTLFLIQHLSAQDLTRYVVRAYDLRRQELLPRRIADRTQRGWVMHGYALTRAASADGRFVYTLYQNPGGAPFVHALDTGTLTAHCVGIPWSGSDQSALWNIRLALRDGGRELALQWRSGRPYLAIDTRGYRISYPHGGFPWAAVLGGSLGGAAVLLAASALLLRRRLRRRAAGPGARIEAVAQH